jgi:hypothetical protein
MSRYIKPASNHACLTSLRRIAKKGTQDASEGITNLRPETLDQVTTFVPQFAAALNNANEAKSAQGVTTAAARTAIKLVSQCIRHIWVAVKRRTSHDGLPAAAQLHYGLAANGKSLQIGTQDAWLTQAERIIEGEEAAVAADYPALAAPTVAQLQIRLTAALDAVSQREAAKASYKIRAAALNSLRQQADRLIATAMHELRVSLRGETASSRRETMRSYGARFSQRTEASVDAPEDEPVVEEERAEESEKSAASTVISMNQPDAVLAVNGNGTAVHA